MSQANSSSGTDGLVAAPMAGVWRRLAAGFYDLLLLAAVWMLVTLIVIVLRGGEAISPGSLPYQLLLFIVAAAFFISSWLRGGQTLGMRAWRIRLEKRSGAAIDLRTGLLRFAAGLLTVLSCGAGLLWLWVDRDRLTWHDRLAGTRVVRLPEPDDFLIGGQRQPPGERPSD